jgi:hypothetical protein
LYEIERRGAWGREVPSLWNLNLLDINIYLSSIKISTLLWVCHSAGM